MRKAKPVSLKRKVMTAAVMGMLGVGVASPAFAWGISVGGGQWAYAVSVCCNWSEYLHNSVNHGSSVQNSQGLVRSACEPPTVLAYATETADISGNKAYWRYC